MPFLDTREMALNEKRPGWRGHIFSSASMTFANWNFDAGAAIHEHVHDQEEVWQVIEGQLEIVIDGEAQIAGPGMVAIAPAGSAHSVQALTDGRAMVVDHPAREGF